MNDRTADVATILIRLDHVENDVNSLWEQKASTETTNAIREAVAELREEAKTLRRAFYTVAGSVVGGTVLILLTLLATRPHG